MSETIIGIDPGKGGGIAALHSREGSFMGCHSMPNTEADTWAIIDDINGYEYHSFCYIEKVASMPGQGVKSTFTFGQNYGMLRAFLIAAGIPFEAVSPGTWQKSFSLPKKSSFPGSDSQQNTSKKNAHKARAQELFPDAEVTHAVADALLIAEYGRRLRAKGTA